MKQRRIKSIVVFILILLLLSPMLFFLFYQFALIRATNRHLREIHSLGYPSTIEDLEKLYVKKIPENNGAVLFNKAFSSMPNRDEKYWQLRSKTYYANATKVRPIKPLSDEIRETTKEYLIEYEDFLKIFYDACENKNTLFEYDFISRTFNDWSGILVAREVLIQEAVYAAEIQHNFRAFRAIKAYASVSNINDQHPIRFGTDFDKNEFFESMIRILNRTTFTDNELNEMDQIFKSMKSANLGLVFAANCVQQNDLVMNAKKYGYRIPSKVVYMGYPIRDKYITSATYSDLIKASEKPFWESVNLEKQIEEKYDAEIERKFLWQKIYYRTTYLCQDIQEAAKAESYLRCARMAIAVERFRRKNGKLPTDLKEVVPEFIEKVLDDPLTGKPLLYETRKEEFNVYSVGLNQVDDGCNYDKDIVFTILIQSTTSPSLPE